MSRWSEVCEHGYPMRRCGACADFEDGPRGSVVVFVGVALLVVAAAVVLSALMAVRP